jgi:dTDP-4-dehydrorhamnose reductase
VSVLVPGGGGLLGGELAKLDSAALRVTAPGSAELNLIDTGAVGAAVGAFAEQARADGRAPVVINAAAYTAVDAAESDERKAFAVNVDGPRVLAAVCSSHRVPLLHISTDYVFAGDADRAYEPDDPVVPVNAYGRTKAAGEDAVLGSGASAWVVRTSWLYGEAGDNFVRTMIRLERERDTLSVVDDQVGSPTWSADLAGGLVELAMAVVDRGGPARRVLHCAADGQASWCDLAKAVFIELGADPDRISPCTTEEFPRPAPRPAYSVLSNASWREAGLTPLRPWRPALTEFVALHRAELG